MNKTPIEWTNLTLNPIRARMKDGSNRVPGHYCEKISPGCKNCYASRWQPRARMPTFDKADLDEIEVYLDEDVLHKVLRRRKPARIFWCDMTDMFGSWVPDEWIIHILAVMALTPHLTHQILTKRPERMRELLSDSETWLRIEWKCADLKGPDEAPALAIREPQWLISVHLGVSVENQEQADKRIPELLNTPAAVRFLSVEPLPGPVDLGAINVAPKKVQRPPHPGAAKGGCSCAMCQHAIEKTRSETGTFDLVPMNAAEWLNCLTGEIITSMRLGYDSDNKVDWVIVGGESGPNARPMHPDWARSIRDQCAAAGVPFFFKQWGAWLPFSQQDPNVDKQWLGRFKTVFNDGKVVDGLLDAWPEIRPKVSPAQCVGKKTAGRLLDGSRHNEMPEATP